jgi:outer membrane protein TolC
MNRKRKEKMIMKKASMLLVATLMLVNFSFAKDFTLEEAIELAKQNNSSLITLKAEQRQQEKDYKSVKKDDQIWKSKQGYSLDSAEDYLMHHGDALETAQLKYDLYLKSIENAEDSVEYTLISTVYNLELLEKNIEILEENVELMENQKLVYELKYKLNWITKLELDNFILSLSQTKNTLESTKAKYDLGKESLRIMLSQTEEVNIILPEIDNTEIIIEDINEYCNENIGKNKNLMSLKYNYKALENYYITLKQGFYDELLPNAKFETKVQKDNYEAMKQQIDIVVNNLSTAYISHYNDIKMSDLSLRDQKNKLDLAKVNMEVVQTRYEAGYVAELDYKAACISLKQSEIAYESERVNNMLLKEKFERFVDSGFVTVE